MMVDYVFWDRGCEREGWTETDFGCVECQDSPNPQGNDVSYLCTYVYVEYAVSTKEPMAALAGD